MIALQPLLGKRSVATLPVSGPHSKTRIIAGAWCVVEGGVIVRAAKASQAEPTRIWVAGRGVTERGATPQPQSWPAHYA